MSKRTLTLADIEAQTAFALPERDTMLVTVLINIGAIIIPITVQDVNVAAQICGVLVAQGIGCTIQQG